MNHAAKPTRDRDTPSRRAGMAKVLSKARRMVAHSTAEEAAGFDVEGWLERWIERPQPSLGGRPPSEFLDTPSGTETVCRLLGAVESGAYL